MAGRCVFRAQRGALGCAGLGIQRHGRGEQVGPWRNQFYSVLWKTRLLAFVRRAPSVLVKAKATMRSEACGLKLGEDVLWTFCGTWKWAAPRAQDVANAAGARRVEAVGAFRTFPSVRAGSTTCRQDQSLERPL